MKFSFDINGVEKEVSYVKEETSSAITGVESLIDSNIYGAEMTDANAEFNAIDVDMSIIVNGFEASGNKDNAAAKPGFLKRTWDAIKALFKALGKYMSSALKWIKSKFKKNKAEKIVNETASIYEKCVNECNKVKKENPNDSDEELAKKMKARLDEMYGYGYGPEAEDRQANTIPAYLPVRFIISEIVRSVTKGEGGNIKIPVALPHVGIGQVESVKSIINGMDFNTNKIKDLIYYVCVTLNNGLYLVEFTDPNSESKRKILKKEDLNSDNFGELKNTLANMAAYTATDKKSYIVLQTVNVQVKDDATKAAVITAIKADGIYKEATALYDVLFDILDKVEKAQKELFNDAKIDEVVEALSKDATSSEDPTVVKSVLKDMQSLIKDFTYAISRESVKVTEDATRVG